MLKTRKDLLYFIPLVVVLTVFSGIFIHYISLAGSRVPIMDYWEWIANYGPKFADKSISIRDFVINPDKSAMSAQHMSPGSMALQFYILYWCKFDVRILVILGTAIRLGTGWILSFVFLKKFYGTAGNKLLLITTDILLFISYINLNQWEVMSQPFAFTFSMRIGLYLISFAWAQNYFNQMETRTIKQNIIHTCLFGIYCVCLTVLVSSAYFVAHLFAIIFIGLVKFIRCSEFRKKCKLHLVIFIVMQVLGVAVYFLMMHLSAGAKSSQVAGISFNVLDVIKGIFVYMGSLLIHQSLVEAIGYIPCLLIGIFLFVMVGFAIFLYFKQGLDKINLFPLMCIVYAGTNAAAIAVGRVSSFGVGTMTSSRYVVESTVGLIGLIWIWYDILQTSETGLINSILKFVLAIELGMALLYSMQIELKIAPYRGIYNEQLYEYMLNIDDTEDADLAVFQNSPENVRYVTQFFKENGYSIFSPGFVYK